MFQSKRVCNRCVPVAGDGSVNNNEMEDGGAD